MNVCLRRKIWTGVKARRRQQQAPRPMPIPTWQAVAAAVVAGHRQVYKIRNLQQRLADIDRRWESSSSVFLDGHLMEYGSLFFCFFLDAICKYHNCDFWGVLCHFMHGFADAFDLFVIVAPSFLGRFTCTYTELSVCLAWNACVFQLYCTVSVLYFRYCTVQTPWKGSREGFLFCIFCLFLIMRLLY